MAVDGNSRQYASSSSSAMDQTHGIRNKRPMCLDSPLELNANFCLINTVQQCQVSFSLWSAIFKLHADFQTNALILKISYEDFDFSKVAKQE